MLSLVHVGHNYWHPIIATSFSQDNISEFSPIDHFKDVNNNKGIGTLLRMSGPEAFPVAPFLNLRSVKTCAYVLSLVKMLQLRYLKK